MIRINLLPVKQSRRQRRAITQLALFAGAIVAMLVVAIGAVWFFGARVDERRGIVEANKKQIVTLKEEIGKVNEAEEQRKRLESQLGVIEVLKRGKLGPVRVLDALSSDVPKRVWVTSFTEDNSNVVLRGTGLENADISEFMRQMQKNKYFSDVRLEYTESTVRNGVTIFNFSIIAKVNYSA